MRRAGNPAQAIVGALIGVVTLGAAVTIVLVLTGSAEDRTGAQAIETAVALALFTLTGVSGSNLARRRTLHTGLGYLTIAVAVAALVVVVVTVWTADSSLDNGKVVPYAVVLALATGHASALLGAERAKDTAAIRGVRLATLAALTALVVLAYIDIASASDPVSGEAIAVVLVLYLLGTLLHFLLRSVFVSAKESDRPSLVGLDHVVVAVSDWQRSNAFYRDVLGAEIVERPSGRTAYRIGAQRLNVHGPGGEASPLAANPVRPGNSDLCFRWEGDADSAATHLRGLGVEVVEGPVARTGAAGDGTSVYCRDPDGSLIELISYRV